MSKEFTPEAIAKLPYRPCVGIVLFNAHGEVFIAQRLDNPGPAWQMPQGGIDDGEEPLTAARREMLEEIGTNKATLLAESRGWLHYDLPIDLVPKIWKGRFRGQRQKWFAFRFDGKDSEINIKTETPEFSAWRWAEFDTVPDLIVPFKRGIYQDVVAEFRELVRKARL
ncbi:RNA pyrophosphohydrolase [Dongia soli]|uniref:RNA pyrophosphohydrolase n=1 Tax=Dongia soli TaxID=600628 RepID=A0ABU5E5C1_9PROT|nr:RNA pyrophosphohydrolase [Dongia soli]MDY0881515.1 RNA pyrophosphohydrolase [Dongia soli]